MSTSTISMAAQAAAFPVKLASPSTIRLLTELAQTGEIPYELSLSETEDDDELSDECSDGDCDECTDPDCPCECHDDDSDFDLVQKLGYANVPAGEVETFVGAIQLGAGQPNATIALAKDRTMVGTRMAKPDRLCIELGRESNGAVVTKTTKITNTMVLEGLISAISGMTITPPFETPLPNLVHVPKSIRSTARTTTRDTYLGI